MILLEQNITNKNERPWRNQVDAVGLKPTTRKGVGVRFPPGVLCSKQ